MGSNSWTIIGSGFGLYGYLPAIIAGNNSKIFLPERIKSKMLERSELKSFCPIIHWTDDYTSAFNDVTCVAISVPPEYQYEYLQQIVTYSNIKSLILEKPMAINPAKSFELLSILEETGKNYLVNYSFWYTQWASDISSQSLAKFEKLEINWSFMAHHFRNDKESWKRYHSQGGGPIRFYGIHLIALLAKSAYSNVLNSNVYPDNSDSIEKWTATFYGDQMPDCHVMVNSKSKMSEFSIVGFIGKDKYDIVNLEEPFALESFPDQDSRSSVIQKVVSSLTDPARLSIESLYKTVVELWECVEREVDNK